MQKSTKMLPIILSMVLVCYVPVSYANSMVQATNRYYKSLSGEANLIIGVAAYSGLVYSSYRLSINDPDELKELKNTFTVMLYFSGSLVLVAAFLPSIVATLPLQFSMQAYEYLYVDEKSSNTKKRHAAHNLPDMKVKTINKDKNNNLQIYLADPNDYEQFLVLTLAADLQHQTHNFKEEQMISFKPSAQKSGWFLQNKDGIALAFIATPNNEQDNFSQLF